MDSANTSVGNNPPHTTLAQNNTARPAFGAQLGSKAFLVVVSSPQFGLLQVVGAPPLKIGRGKECQLRLEDPAVSTVHCTVTVDPRRGWVIEDAGSTNGTQVNGRRIPGELELSYGDRINVGSTIIRFYIEEVPERPYA